eukprot:Gb_23439 [translate_table: standard]
MHVSPINVNFFTIISSSASKSSMLIPPTFERIVRFPNSPFSACLKAHSGK